MLNWLIRWKPAPGTESGRLVAGDIPASIASGLVAFALAWPTIEVSLKAVVPALPESARPSASLLISSLAAIVACGTQLYRMWHQEAPKPPSPVPPQEPTK